MSFNSYDLANTSLVKMGGLTEMYIPLWYYSSGSAGASVTTPGSAFIGKGGSGYYGSSSTNTKLHTLNANWSINQQFALEVSLDTNMNGTAYAELWDMTVNTGVAISQIALSTGGGGYIAGNFSLVRSGKFTLTLGHTYGITVWNSGQNSGQTLLSKASLVAFIGG